LITITAIAPNRCWQKWLYLLTFLKITIMSKIIIKNQTEIDDISVLTLIQRVIKNGRISNNGKQFCYLTSFDIDNQEYHIVTDLNKCSDVFTFYAVSF
jgi:hypothetical protein